MAVPELETVYFLSGDGPMKFEICSSDIKRVTETLAKHGLMRCSKSEYLDATRETRFQVARLERTCYESPSQWEGETTDSKEIYIRYRWGTLRADIDGETIYKRKEKVSWDGFMTDNEMVERLEEYFCGLSTALLKGKLDE